MTITPSSSLAFEHLLVSCRSANPYSTVVVDPRTGVSFWSYKGSELQGGTTGLVAPIDGHLLVSLSNAPFFHLVGVCTRFHARCNVGGTVRAFCTTSDGSLLVAAIGSKIYVWLMSNGCLLGVHNIHVLSVKCLFISDDDAFVVSGSDDGAVKVHLLSDLCTPGDFHSPVRGWSAHSLSVTSLSLSRGRSLRIASSSLDHTVCIHSVSLDACLLRIRADRPVTSCLLSSCETELFVGSDMGTIAKVDLFDAARRGRNEVHVTVTEDNDMLLRKHECAITALASSADGALLASADVDGTYVVWEPCGRQVLLESKMAASVSTLSFVDWNYHKTSSSRLSFALQISQKSDRSIPLLNTRQMDSQAHWDTVIEQLLRDTRSNKQEEEDLEATPTGAETPNTSADGEIQKLKAENAKLRKINAELYSFAAKELVG